MDLYEYQARELFEAHGVPVPPGEVATTPAGAEMAAVRIGGPVVVKAQVMTGGRGKAGGVRLAATPAEAREHAEAILGMDIKGHRVHRVLVTAASEIVEEYYVSLLLDRGRRSFLAMASAEGGVEIEELARERPEALIRMPIDDATGVDEPTARRLVTEAGFPAAVVDAAAEIVTALWATAVAEDATLVEVNPLARVAGDRVLALDGKVTLDDNAAFRRPERPEWAEVGEADSREAAARARDLNYVKLEGEVGVIGNGAGLVMSTLDVVADAGRRHGGRRPANFLDIGGGASAAVMTDGLDIVLGDPDVRSVLVNVFGGITACDQVAAGIVAALEQLGEAATKPLVVRLDGNNVEAGRAILADAAHPLVTVVADMDSAADTAAALAGTGV